jgi:hypothetical protein
LGKITTHAQDLLDTYVVFAQPDGVEDEWVRSGLWRSASEILGVKVLPDTGGVEARRFGAATSGHAFLFSRAGELLFNGGITAVRGHAGDNPGASAILSLIIEGTAEIHETAVFGCPLLDS